MNKRIWMMLVAIVLVVSIVPMAALAAECTCDTKHVHDAECGYVEAHACDICGATANCPNCIQHAINPGSVCNGRPASACTHVCHTHSWGEQEVIDTATCTEDGYTTIIRRCACGATTNDLPQIASPAKGHNMSDATCTAPATCSKCGATEGEALGHAYGEEQIEKIITPATCTESGIYTYVVVCANCGDEKAVLPQLPIEAKGHDMADATCTAPATCKNGCGLTEGEALGHAYGEEQIKKIIKPATCKETGIYTYVVVCANCGDEMAILPQMELDKVDHEWDDGVVTIKPTYTTKGQIVYTCKYGCTMADELDTLQAPAVPGTAGLDYVPKTGSIVLEWLYALIFG